MVKKVLVIRHKGVTTVKTISLRLEHRFLFGIKSFDNNKSKRLGGELEIRLCLFNFYIL